MRVRDLPFGAKLSGVIFVCALVVGTVFATGLFILREAITEQRKFATQTVVETAHSVLVRYAELESSGQMAHDEAQKQALEVLRHLRYSGSNYFFVSDLAGVMLMHPVAKNLEGKNLSDLKDTEGKYFYREFFDKAHNASGFVFYHWPKPGSQESTRKLSYVQAFKPWNMMVLSGVYMDDVDKSFADFAKILSFIGGGGMLLIVGASLLFHRHMVGPLKTVAEATRRLIAGETHMAVRLDRRDEVGALADSLDTFAVNMQQMHELEERQAEERQRAEEVRRQFVQRLAGEMEQEIRSVAGKVLDAAVGMKSTATQMSTLASGASGRAGEVAAAAERATHYVQTVAVAAEELTASIREIGTQSVQSANIASTARDTAAQTTEQVRALSEAVGRISEVVQMITDIASQTNLLALNATIEAARAGEAGKGFAVVANEVKSLANQTAKATSSIIDQVAAVQTATQGAVGAIDEIVARINDINEVSTAIASAVEEQAAATNEIASSAQQAASGTEDVSRHIREVNEAASNVGSAAGSVLSSADQLTLQAHELDGQIVGFTAKMRA